jgi:hypothetical protein
MLNVIMLNVIMLNVIMLNVIMLNVILLNVVMLSVVMLNVMAPFVRNVIDEEKVLHLSPVFVFGLVIPPKMTREPCFEPKTLYLRNY